MPYYITKEVINNYVLNIFSNANAPYDIMTKISEDLTNGTFLVLQNASDIEKLTTLVLNETDIGNIVDLLFQVKDYKYYLSYVLQAFLYSKHFNEICILINRTFVNHIGEENYASKKLNYEFNERYFDRFIEAVKFCGIDNFKILPFLFAIYNSEKGTVLNKYLRPSKEFLEEFISKNEGSYLNYINTEEFYVTGYEIYCELFPKKGVQKLIDNLFLENYFKKEDINKLFTDCGEVGILELQNYILKATPDKQKLALEFYLSFGNYVKATLPFLYDKLENEKLKAVLKDEIDFSKNVRFETINEFIEYAESNARDYVTEGISSKYLIYFKNGIKANDAVISCIFKTLQNVTDSHSIKKFEILSNFFSQSELDNLGFMLIKDLGGNFNDNNKWISVYVSAVCSSLVISKLMDVVPTCLVDSRLSSYVLTALCQTGQSQVVNFVKQTYMQTSNKQYYYQFLEILAESAGISALDYLDEMISSYGLEEDGTKVILCNGENLKFEITENLSVKVKNCNTNNYINLTDSNFSDSENALKFYGDLTYAIMEQIAKFKNAFELKRMWQPKIFVSNILYNPLLKKIASTLVFGAYEKGNFVKIVELNEIENLEDNFKISLVHPCELNSEELKNFANKFEPFKQINSQIFKPTNYDFSNSYSSVFNGVCVSDLTFNARIKTFDYKMSIDDGVYYYKVLKQYNLLVKVDIVRSTRKNVSIVGNIEFYNLNLLEFVNNKYILLNAVPEQIGSISTRVYSLVLSQIYDVCFK